MRDEVNPYDERKGSQNPWAQRELATQLATAGLWHEAVATIDHAVSLCRAESERAGMLADKGWMLYSMGEVDQASSLAKKAITMTESTKATTDVILFQAIAHNLIAHCAQVGSFTRRDEAAKAAELFDKVTQTEADTDWHQARVMRALAEGAQSHLLLGNADKATVNMKRLLAYEMPDEKRADFLIDLGKYLHASGMLAEAEESLTEAKGYLHERIATRFFMEWGRLLRDLDRPADAYDAFEQCILSLKTHVNLSRDVLFNRDVRLELAEAAFKCGHFRRAAAAYKDALPFHLNQDGLRSNCQHWIAVCQMEIGEIDEAIENLKEVVKSTKATPDDRESAQRRLSDIHLWRCRCDIEAGNATGAARECMAALPLVREPSDAARRELLLFMGRSFEENGLNDMAWVCYETISTWPSISGEEYTQASEGLSRLSRKERR